MPAAAQVPNLAGDGHVPRGPRLVPGRAWVAGSGAEVGRPEVVLAARPGAERASAAVFYAC